MENILTVIIFSVTTLMLMSNKCLAQKGILVDKDDRIAVLETQLLNYLKNNGEFTDVSKFSFDAFKDRMIVKKRIEFFSQESYSQDLLVIRFQATSDHGNVYWGILKGNEHYFYYDLNDKQFLTFKKKEKLAMVKLIEDYCRNFE